MKKHQFSITTISCVYRHSEASDDFHREEAIFVPAHITFQPSNDEKSNDADQYIPSLQKQPSPFL
jgi:hypothetical protein